MVRRLTATDDCALPVWQNGGIGSGGPNRPASMVESLTADDRRRPSRRSPDLGLLLDTGANVVQEDVDDSSS